MEEIYKKITANLKCVSEEHFRYFDLKEKFEITINFIAHSISVPDHTHEENVFNYVLEGELTVGFGSESRTLKKGDWIEIAANTTHRVSTLSDTVLLELWKK